ncbi:MAG: hypothetical protein NC311_19490 [Muribaculaceae bacterium]|nr:hypothetical protein [Muribaculaceae bacterium]
MTAIKEKIIGAITVMSEDDAETIWKFILEKYSTSWDDIEEVAPDDIDMQMLQDIDNDPECREFTNESDIVW